METRIEWMEFYGASVDPEARVRVRMGDSRRAQRQLGALVEHMAKSHDVGRGRGAKKWQERLIAGHNSDMIRADAWIKFTESKFLV